jgi:formate dehydrogenase iron-sulfur subunit
MAEMAVLVDVSRCTGCRGCQVACKQWNKNPARETCFTGTYENPPDLECDTFTRVVFREVEDAGKLAWLFRKDQCRHCLKPGCVEAEGSPMKKLENGIVLADPEKKVTEEVFEEVKSYCPYNIPRYDPDSQTIRKCTFCFDRQEMGKKPACVTACLSGALFYGTREEVLKEGEKRIAELKKRGFGKAALIDESDVSWIYLFTHPAKQYGMFFDPSRKQKVALG